MREYREIAPENDPWFLQVICHSVSSHLLKMASTIMWLYQSDCNIMTQQQLSDIFRGWSMDDAESLFYLSSLQLNTYTFAKSADPDKMACNKPSHLDLHCLSFCYLF